MTSGFYGPEDFGSSPFDDFLARIYGSGAPRQPVHRVEHHPPDERAGP